MRPWLALAVVCAFHFALPAPTAMAAVAGAAPTTLVVPVQPIDVCDNTGANCANTSGLAAYETIANLVFQQAGVQFAFAPAVKYDNAQYLNDTVDTTGITVFDQAHDLVRTPGHSQSTIASALNVYFVNNLISTTGGVVNQGASTLGYGLVGGNGAVVATAPDANGNVAGLDTLAHELGHNLGLTHVTDPYNLMDGTNRATLVTTCQIAPYTCAAPQGSSVGPVAALTPEASGGHTVLVKSGFTTIKPGMIASGAGIPANDPVVSVSGPVVTLAAKFTAPITVGESLGFAAAPQTDLLTPSQIAIARSPPIFTELANVASIIGSEGGCVIATPICSQLVSYVQSNPGQSPLTGIKYRFLDPSEVLSLVASGAGGATVTANPVAGHVEFDVTPQPAVQPGQGAANALTVDFAAPPTPACPNPLASCYDNVPPFSVEFDFANGTTSRAGFDSAINGYSSQDGQVVGFDPGASNLPTGPSILPVDNVPTDTDTFPVSPEIVASIQPPLDIFAATPVPEPPVVALFLTATVFLGAASRRGYMRHLTCGDPGRSGIKVRNVTGVGSVSKLIQAGSAAAVVVLLSVAPALAGSGSGCSINGVSVPEPSTLAVLGAGGVAALLYRKYRGK